MTLITETMLKQKPIWWMEMSRNSATVNLRNYWRLQLEKLELRKILCPKTFWTARKFFSSHSLGLVIKRTCGKDSYLLYARPWIQNWNNVIAAFYSGYVIKVYKFEDHTKFKSEAKLKKCESFPHKMPHSECKIFFKNLVWTRNWSLFL